MSTTQNRNSHFRESDDDAHPRPVAVDGYELGALARYSLFRTVELCLRESDALRLSATGHHPAACWPENVHMLPQAVFHRVITA
jgi:hypothetical protein